MGTVEVKRVDSQRRLVLPKSWREKWGRLIPNDKGSLGYVYAYLNT